jgi:hypothetical protein
MNSDQPPAPPTPTVQPPSEKITYKFWASGHYPDGVKARFQGEVTGPPGYPSAVYEKALAACHELAPGFVMKGDKPGVTTFPTLKALKPKAKRIP